MSGRKTIHTDRIHVNINIQNEIRPMLSLNNHILPIPPYAINKYKHKINKFLLACLAILLTFSDSSNAFENSDPSFSKNLRISVKIAATSPRQSIVTGIR